MSSKWKLNFLVNYEAIFCGDLEKFGNNKGRYIDEVEDTSGRKGVYVILSEKEKFIYPYGTSRVIYIGKADNLIERLKRHKSIYNKICKYSKQKQRENWSYSRYYYMKKFGAKVYYIPALGNQNAHNLEMNIMEEFYNKYFALPVGNGAFSFGKN